MTDSFSAGEEKGNFEPPEVIRERLRDPKYLPTVQEVTRAFTPADFHKWQEFCIKSDPPIYELFTQEQIKALSSYFVERRADLAIDDGQPITILEVGAGNGKLSHFLKQQLDKVAPDKFRVIATDSGEWDLDSSGFPVEQLDYPDAITKYNPTVVVSSWMPHGEDWTPAFRESDNVKEYLLIGEADGGSCGADETWTEHDGFARKDLEEMSKSQFCVADAPGKSSHSSTVSFRRE